MRVEGAGLRVEAFTFGVAAPPPSIALRFGVALVKGFGLRVWV